MEDIVDSQVPDTQDSLLGEEHYEAPFREAGIIRKVELINFMCHAYVPQIGLLFWIPLEPIASCIR